MPSPDQPVLMPSVPMWLRLLVHGMDEAITIPGTRFSIGWDAIAGFVVPGVGDAVSAVSHVALLIAAFRARVPRIVLARMTGNAAFDALTGMVPILGDAFDIAFKANKRNLELLERALHAEPQRKVTTGDYLVVFGAISAVLLVMTLPIVFGVLLAHWLFAKL